MLTIDGLVTGIDTGKVVEGLLEIQQKQIDKLNQRQADVKTKQAAFGGLQAQLLSLRASVSTLATLRSSPFAKRLVTVSNEQIAAATATTAATPGIYRFQVNSLATAHQLASNGVNDPDAEITQGTLTFRVGAGPETTITIDDTNNTLAGLAQAINAAGTGVNASLFRDDSSGTPAYRILLASQTTGADQQITITNGLGPAGGSATLIDFAQEVQAAENASITLGSGPGAITVHSGTNEFNDLIQGVRINLLKAAPGEEVTLAVAQDVDAAVTAVSDFVSAFNDVLTYIDAQTSFNPQTQKAGLLLGNRSITTIQDRLRRTVLDVIPGINSQANRLSAVGISVSDQGRLVLNETRLRDVLSGRVPGVAPGDLTKLFALTGSSSHAGVTFLSGSNRTQTSVSPYQVDLTQAAERAHITATSVLAETTVIDETNNQLTLTLDKATATLTLAAGSYTRQELAAHLETLINSSPELPGRAISVALSGDMLQLTSKSYGSGSQIRIDAGTSLAALGLTVGQSDSGVDVAGTFLVNGASEPAVGQGQLLSGNLDNEHTADLQVRVQLGPSQIIAGPEAELTVTRGISARLDQILGEILDPVKGDLAIVDQRFVQDLEHLQRAADRQLAMFEQKQQALLQEFSRLEAAISRMQSIGNQLSAQLAGLAGLKSS